MQKVGIVAEKMFSRLAGFIERTVLSLLFSRNEKERRGYIDPTPIGRGLFPLLMAISVLLCVRRCKHKVHDFVEVLDELYVRYFVSDADQKEKRRGPPPPTKKETILWFLFSFPRLTYQASFLTSGAPRADSP